MESINLNLPSALSGSIFSPRTINSTTPSYTSTTPLPGEINSSAEIKLSPEAKDFLKGQIIRIRFSSSEEANEHKTKMAEEVMTREEFLTGKRRPFTSSEDERLSKLTLQELLQEANQLPRIDSNGYLLGSVHGTPQGDRIGVAISNLMWGAHFALETAAGNVASSMSLFKGMINDKLKIDSSSYDIIYSNGKATVVGIISSKGKPITEEAIKKIQQTLGSSSITESRNLIFSISDYNKAALERMNYEVERYVYGPTRNPYLPKSASMDWLLSDTSYSKVEGLQNVQNKYLELIADARAKMNAAVKDGTHLSNYDIDPGLLELTRLRNTIETNI